MNKIKIFLLSLTVIGFSLSGYFLVKAQLNNQTVVYLQNQPQTEWITQGLSATGQTDIDISYLDDFNGDIATEYAKAILAVIAGGGNPYDFNDQDLVAGLLTFYNNNQFGVQALLNDDMWSMIALTAAGENPSRLEIQEAKNYLLAAQDELDGGWAYALQANSDTNMTASAIMALISAGVSPNAQYITDALDFLADSQRDNGGFGFYEGSEADSGSTAWVIAALNRLNIDANSWQKNNNSGFDYLQSLYLPDGSYKWISTDTAGNALMTAYVAVALSDAYYPVAMYEPQDNGEPELFNLRIESPEETICDAMVAGQTALEVVQNGADICGYTYEIEQTGYGPYLSSINDLAEEGIMGWLYFVNWLSPQQGSADYILATGDEVLWSYGQFGTQPMRLSLSASQIEPGQSVDFLVEYFNGTAWLAVNQAEVYVGQQIYFTNSQGQASLTLDQTGQYEVFAQKENFIRTKRQTLQVGSGVSQTVNLSVMVENDNGGNDDQLSFMVNIANLDFGTVTPGASSSRFLTITNNGNLPIYLEGVVNGDSLFEENLQLGGQMWENYNLSLNSGQDQELNVRLEIPSDYVGSGAKNADLILWGSAN